ncbi:MAG TPA: hypothetical protein DCR55_09455 [Lentisphaeria bacterium]|nr:hypothetical protein [Lentisphaeria bacterium]
MTKNSTRIVRGENWKDPVLNVEFIWLPALEFWVGKHVTTNAEYRAFNAAHDSGEYEGETLNGDRQPVVQVSYEDAMAYCGWFTERLRDRNAIQNGQFLRLPSHQEWTVFASCGKQKEFPWGDEWPPIYGNYADETARRKYRDWEHIAGYDDHATVTCPVEESGANEWGLWGVGGNVYEWTFQAGGTSCELRGGSWTTCQKEYLRINNRYPREPSTRLLNFGFRPVLVL